MLPKFVAIPSAAIPIAILAIGGMLVLGGNKGGTANATPTPALSRSSSAIAHQVYTAANVAGYGEEDYAAVVRFLEAAAPGPRFVSAQEILAALRLENVRYAIRDLAVLADEVARTGKKILPLNIGDPLKFDFATPPHMIEATLKAYLSAVAAARADALQETLRRLDSPVAEGIGS